MDTKPDNWSRTVRSAGDSERAQTYRRFRGEFLPRLHEAHPDWSRTPQNFPRSTSVVGGLRYITSGSKARFDAGECSSIDAVPFHDVPAAFPDLADPSASSRHSRSISAFRSIISTVRWLRMAASVHSRSNVGGAASSSQTVSRSQPAGAQAGGFFSLAALLRGWVRKPCSTTCAGPFTLSEPGPFVEHDGEQMRKCHLLVA